MAIEKHIHKYQRVDIGVRVKHIVYKCMLTGCTHYLTPAQVVGAEHICWRCNKPVRMTQPMANLKKPHCINCRQSYPESRKRGLKNQKPEEITNASV